MNNSADYFLLALMKNQCLQLQTDLSETATVETPILSEVTYSISKQLPRNHFRQMRLLIMPYFILEVV